MGESRKLVVSIYADRSGQQWVVRDREGNLWIVPSMENPWEHRQRFYPTEETILEPLPGHYRGFLGLPG